MYIYIFKNFNRKKDEIFWYRLNSNIFGCLFNYNLVLKFNNWS